ncbi:MAG: DUF2617 family protein [Phycisphaerae bacterium]|jgi:hypothetical protein
MSTGQNLKAATLRFYLYNRPLHPELFEVYHDHHIVSENYEAQVWITGCTHVIGFYRGKDTLLEVTADAGSGLPPRGLMLELPFRGEKVHETRQLPGMNYMMNFQVESMSPRVYSQTHHELARQGAQRGMFVPFPMWMSKGLTPFTFIDYTVKPDQFHVFAFHAFPEDLTIVKTQSIFELVGEPKGPR